ncbi:mechanosensitive ion channel domain-containing protein [Chryseolinea sp. T2]|uniref:mechanosensitive ion channel family protein n=1 Tax=Chryseolinea sp. T2 TaxID=3129255 RepID=UPI0030777999
MDFFLNDLKSFAILFGVAAIVYGISFVVIRLATFILTRLTGSSSTLVKKKLGPSIRFLTAVIALNIANRYTKFERVDEFVIDKIILLLLIAAIAMLLIKLSAFVRDLLYERYDVRDKNNLNSRKVRTQIDFLQKSFSAFIVFLAISISLMSFERVREMGTSLIASAGIASVIIGFAAQKSIANLFAGFQIAFTQPLRLDDVVVVEGEWGRIEEITLTYVVINIWDQRRLIVPIGYFLEKPFYNWTRNSSELLGTVFFYLDYSFPVDFIRSELKKILLTDEARLLWDGRTAAVQVTDITDRVMQVRVLVSASTSGAAFDLRCLIRERMLESISKEYPTSLPKARFQGGDIVDTSMVADDSDRQ